MEGTTKNKITMSTIAACGDPIDYQQQYEKVIRKAQSNSVTSSNQIYPQPPPYPTLPTGNYNNTIPIISNAHIEFIRGQRVQGIPLKKKDIDKNKLPVYSLDDMDSVIAMLTVWIDDRSIVSKMEKMYKHWKSVQK